MRFLVDEDLSPRVNRPGAVNPVGGADPAYTNPELAVLNSWLDYHRATLLSKLNGLTDEQAGERKVGSDTTLHGLVRQPDPTVMTRVCHEGRGVNVDRRLRRERRVSDGDR